MARTMTSPNPADAYLRSKVLSARPEELRLMLIEGAIKFARQGADGIASKNWEMAFNGMTRCKNILLELISSLRPEVAPDICSKLSALYMYMYRRLIDANLEKNAALVEEVVELLEYDRATWLMVMDKAREEQGLPPLKREDAEAISRAIHDASEPDDAATDHDEPAPVAPVAPRRLPAPQQPARTGAGTGGYSSISIEG